VVKEAASSNSIDPKDPALSDYANKYFTCGYTYLDTEWNFYKALGSRTIGLSGLYEYMWNPFKAWDRVKGLREKNIDGTIGGEGKTLGGVIVMAPGDKGAVYTFLEETGKALPVSEIKDAVAALRSSSEECTSDVR